METVPAAVGRIYPAEVLEVLGRIRRPSPHPGDHLAEPVRLRHVIFSGETLESQSFRSVRAAWWSYLVHADAVGLLDRDLIQRLANADDDLFRGALAECRTSWFFSEKLSTRLRRHAGVGGDFEEGDRLRIEVKAPYVPVRGSAWSGNDADVLAKCIKKAGEQFEQGTMNILVICPLLRTPVWMQRDQIVEASVGKWAISVPVALDGSAPKLKPRPVFLQSGKMAKLFRTAEGGFGPDHRRVSAVVVVEEEPRPDANGLVLQHLVHVVHNPFAAVPAPESMLQAYPQLVARSEGMMWTDLTTG